MAVKTRSAAAQALVSPQGGLGDQTRDQLSDELDERRKKMLKAAGAAGFMPVGAAHSLLGSSGGVGIGSGSGF